MKRSLFPGLLLMVGALAGCGIASRHAGTSGEEIPYRVVNNECNCERYVTTDPAEPITCEFSATYRVEEGVATRIMVTIRNEGRDTLDLSLASVKITSRNLAYRYNDKPLPITVASVPPGGRQSVTLQGDAPVDRGTDPWRFIAGEELLLTLRGMRIQGRLLATQIIRFIPINPRLSS